jgi:hypothetical protein
VPDTSPVITLSPRDYDAILFDLDGVLTKTARVHAAAWKRVGRAVHLSLLQPSHAGDYPVVAAVPVSAAGRGACRRAACRLPGCDVPVAKRQQRRRSDAGTEPECALRAVEARQLVVPFRPLRLSTLHKAQNRSHVRGIVVDGRIGWTGGFSIEDRWLGDGRTNNSWPETDVRFEGPAVRQLQAAFAAAWAEATGTLFSGRATVGDATATRHSPGFSMRRPQWGALPPSASSHDHRWGEEDFVHHEFLLRTR